jgi:malate dehydrogenase
MKLSLIGASGVVGSATAFAIACQGLMDELVLIGRRSNIVKSHTLDIQAAITGYNNTLIRAGNLADLSDSDIVIIAAGVHFPAAAPVSEKLSANLPIITSISAAIQEHCPDAVVITAANPVDLLNYAVYLSTALERRKLLGFNLNDATRFRMSLAKALNVGPERITAQVLGEHPRAPLLVFSSVAVDGQRLVINEAIEKIVRAELSGYLRSFEALQAGRSAGWTTALGLAAFVKAIALDSGEVLPCSTVLKGEYGYRDFSLGIPASIGRKGIRHIMEIQLSENELAELRQITATLAEDSDLVRRLTSSVRL